MLNLFVANINGKVTEATFEHFLIQSGVKYARLRMPDPEPGYNSNNRGYAFITFETREDYAAGEAFLNGREFAGRLLRCAQAKPKAFKHDPYKDLETRRTSSPTVALQPTYRDYAPTGDDLRDKGEL